MTKHPDDQRGASLLSILLFLAVGGIALSMALKLSPAYFEFRTIDSVLTAVSNDPNELRKPLSGIRQDLAKKFRINQIQLQPDALRLSRDRGIIRFDLKYEVRVPMYFNVDALVKFEKNYEAIAP